MELQEALSKLVEVQSQLENLKASTTLDTQKAVQTERSRVLKILDAKTTFAANDSAVVNAISKGWSLDTVTDVFTEVKAAKDALLTVDTTGTSLGSQTPETIAALAAKQAKQEGVSFESDLLTGLEAAGASEQLFKGMR